MHRVEPTIQIIAQTRIDERGLGDYLTSIGALGWDTDTVSDIEELIEVAGRSCYKSFGVELNHNLTRVREGNRPYLENIIKVNHGSVLEHGFVTFAFTNVSRVFTHELVRHRVGTAISQESLRYVLLEDLGLWIPSDYRDNLKAVEIYERAWRQAEENYTALLSSEVLGFNLDEQSFDVKKRYTSAARRVAPIGLATGIIWSCNIRTLRHVIELRTAPSAEEEIRVVFEQVQAMARQEWPALFSGA